MSKPWLVVPTSLIDGYHYPATSKFGTRAEAEMYARSLNKLVAHITYKVIFDDSEVLIA